MRAERILDALPTFCGLAAACALSAVCALSAGCQSQRTEISAPPVRPSNLSLATGGRPPADQSLGMNWSRTTEPPGERSTAAGIVPAAAFLSVSPAEVEETVASAPQDYTLRQEAAAYFVRRGLIPEAQRHLLAATRLKPSDPTNWTTLGDLDTLIHQWPQAQQSYQNALSLSPGFAAACSGLGQLLLTERKLTAARRILEQGLQRNPQNAELGVGLGSVYLSLHQPRRAERVLKQALVQNPGGADAHHLLSRAYSDDLHTVAALQEEQSAVLADPSFAEGWGRIGFYLVTLRRYSEARSAFARALQLAPNATPFLRGMGDSYALDSGNANNAVRAIQLYRRALAQEPANPSTLHALAAILARRDMPRERPELIGTLERALKLNPSDSESLYRLAQAYQRAGHTAQANAALARFQSLASRTAKASPPSATLRR